jgi:putative heme iron utilization protein
MTDAAQEARTLAAGTNVATLATLGEEGHPWAAFVAFATLADGAPVLCLSALAEHGRNLLRDPRASLVVAETPAADAPLDAGRVTLTGTATVPERAQREAARSAYRAAVPGADEFLDLGDFTLFVLRVERVRWVGGFGRMGSADGAAYRAASP